MSEQNHETNTGAVAPATTEHVSAKKSGERELELYRSLLETPKQLKTASPGPWSPAPSSAGC